MKILFIDTQWSGHHEKYFNCLSEHLSSSEVIGVFPKEAPLDNKIKYHVDGHSSKLGFVSYIKWWIDIQKIVRIEKPDIIHFLYADYFYRFFGIFLGFFKKYHTVATFHHVKRSALRDMSLKCIFKSISSGVVHTSSLKSDLKMLGINNIEHIEYPVFMDVFQIDIHHFKTKWSIPHNKKILLALGSTRYDKGLDILLEALKNVKEPFHLIIAGPESDFKESFIKEKANTYLDNLTVVLRYLTDEEVAGFVQSSDYIVLPYRKIFDGASGPLTEGVAMSKLIVGPDHGSLGTIISENNLGHVFKSEDSYSLSETINIAMRENFLIDKDYLNYQKNISENRFISNYKNLYDSIY